MKKIIILSEEDGGAYKGLKGFVINKKYSGIEVRLTKASEQKVKDYNLRNNCNYTIQPLISNGNYKTISQELDII